MDQLLERDPGGAPAEILAEAIEQHMGGAGLDSTLDDTHHDSQVSCNINSTFKKLLLLVVKE